MIRLPFKIALVSLFASSAVAASSTLNPEIVPEPLIKAMQEVHAVAKDAPLKSIFMFKYIYYKAGLCKDEDCSPEAVQRAVDKFKQAMGPDFEELNKKYDFYLQEIRTSQEKSKTGDVDSLLSMRSPDDIFARRTFLTCIDYAKAVASKALANGMKPSDLRFFWMMDLLGYRKMCPSRNGQKAIAPRPLVHTVIAYRMNGKWYVLNSENPNPEIMPMGDRLPNERLSRNFIFSLPALVGGKVLTQTGHFDFAKFIGGFPAKWTANIAASGRATSEDADFACR